MEFVNAECNEICSSLTTPFQSRMASKAPQRPNFFVALRLNDPSLLEIVNRIQRDISTRCPYLSRYMVPSRRFHLTLFVMHLANLDDINAAQRCLAESADDLSELFQNEVLQLKFTGLDTFSNRVLFVYPEDSSILETIHILVDRIHARFIHAGLVESEVIKFSPHATVAKITNYKNNRKNNNKSFKPVILKSHYEGLESHLGSGLPVTLQDIDLLAMNEKDDEGIYYRSYSNIKFPFR
eukprot:gene13260-28082_t